MDIDTNPECISIRECYEAGLHEFCETNDKRKCTVKRTIKAGENFPFALCERIRRVQVRAKRGYLISQFDRDGSIYITAHPDITTGFTLEELMERFQ